VRQVFVPRLAAASAAGDAAALGDVRAEAAAMLSLLYTQCVRARGCGVAALLAGC
jgi:hypothetical protein